MRLWYLSHRRPAKAQASLRIPAVSPEPSLFAHMKYDCKRMDWPKIRHLAPLDGCTCCRMSLRRTKKAIISWDGSFIWTKVYITDKQISWLVLRNVQLTLSHDDGCSTLWLNTLFNNFSTPQILHNERFTILDWFCILFDWHQVMTTAVQHYGWTHCLITFLHHIFCTMSASQLIHRNDLKINCKYELKLNFLTLIKWWS